MTITPKKTYRNPIMENGADPWMYLHTDGYYYFMATRGDRLDLWKSKSMYGINDGTRKTVWLPPASGPNSSNLWAPEIHHLGGKWYIYFTANDGGGDDTRRIYVLENENIDPLKEGWVEKGAVNTEFAGLDGTVLEHGGKLYFMYAGYGHFPEYGSAIYAAEMENPWTLKGSNVLPTKLDMASWTKSEFPVFHKCVENGVFGPGHNSFTLSSDGTEDWIVYHAIPEFGGGGGKRSTRIQKFRWTEDGDPDFRIPLSLDTEISVPSGEV